MRTYDLDALLHPAQAFRHPREVVKDPDLTLSEKRAILASWASDACAVESAPMLRATPCGTPVRFDDVMDALAELDTLAKVTGGDDIRRKARRQALFGRSRHGPSEQSAPRC